jgi:hypothetical protein
MYPIMLAQSKPVAAVPTDAIPATSALSPWMSDVAAIATDTETMSIQGQMFNMH